MADEQGSVSVVAALEPLPVLAPVRPPPGASSPVVLYLASLSQGSRRAQRCALKGVATRLGVRLETCPWWDLRYGHLAGLVAHLKQQYAPATCERTMAAVRGVLRECFLLNLLPGPEWERMKEVRLPRGTRLPRGRALSSAELTAMFGVCDVSTASGARTAAMLAVLVACGLRRAELVGLDLCDLDVASWTLRVLGKGDKERAVPVGAEGARRALLHWTRVRGPRPGALFLAVRQGGEMDYLRGMSDESVRHIVRRVAKRAGVAEVFPHDFRRTYVSELLDHSRDLPAIASIAGHANVATTARYDRRGARAGRQASETLTVPFDACAGRPGSVGP